MCLQPFYPVSLQSRDSGQSAARATTPASELDDTCCKYWRCLPPFPELGEHLIQTTDNELDVVRVQPGSVTADLARCILSPGLTARAVAQIDANPRPIVDPEKLGVLGCRQLTLVPVGHGCG